MSRQTHEERIFSEAIEMDSPEERAAYLAHACGADTELREAVERLIRLDGERRTFLEQPAIASEATIDQAGPALSAGALVDKYKLIEPIGEGGFGAVWLAEQTRPIRRRVALKIIKLGMDTKAVVARFRAERQALAMMDHPNIARALDAGATETGRPYFAMELVAGTPITDYCDRHDLDTRQRLELFLQVCHAVQHAHQKGIIHRDLKPSNILVAEQEGRPVVKVIDFGIAKALGKALTDQTLTTHVHQLMGTPLYMSPEQADPGWLDIDTRTDIYSLGALLYELLTGTPPFAPDQFTGRDHEQVRRLIRDTDPPRPSTRLTGHGRAADPTTGRHTGRGDLSRALRRDLDWVVMKALEKDRSRRYETANGLAMDIERYLSDVPVLARPAGGLYRLRKFIRRNRGGVAVAAAILLVLILGIVGTTAGMFRAVQESRRAEASEQRAREAAQAALAAEAQAERRADELEQVARFQERQLAGIEPASMGSRLRQNILDRRRTALQRAGDDEATIDRAIDVFEQALASVNFVDVALTSLDENVFDDTLAAIDEQFADQPLIRARLLHTVGVTMAVVGLDTKPEAPLTEAVDLRRDHLGPDHSDTLESIRELAWVISRTGGRRDEFLALQREVLAGQRRLHGDEHPKTARSLHYVGIAFMERDEWAEAEPYMREALQIKRRVFGDRDSRTINAMRQVGVTLLNQNKLDEAESYLRRSVDALRASEPTTLTERQLYEEFGETPFPGVVLEHRMWILPNYAELLRRQGRPEQGEPYLREALADIRAVRGDEYRETSSFLGMLINTLSAQGKHAEVAKSRREVLEIQRRTLGDEHPTTLHSMESLGVALGMQGRNAEAESVLRNALEGFRRVSGDEHHCTLHAINQLTLTLYRQGRHAEAEQYHREVLEVRRRRQGDEHPATLHSLNGLAWNLVQQGRHAEAEPYARQAVEGQRGALGDEHDSTLASIHTLGAALAGQGQYAEAESTFREVLQVWRRELGEEHRYVGDTRSRLGHVVMRIAHDDETLDAQVRHERYADAEQLLLAGYEVLAEAPNVTAAERREAAERLAELHEAWDRPEEAARWAAVAEDHRADEDDE